MDRTHLFFVYDLQQYIDPIGGWVASSLRRPLAHDGLGRPGSPAALSLPSRVEACTRRLLNAFGIDADILVQLASLVDFRTVVCHVESDICTSRD